MSTKEKIIFTSIELFSKNGIAQTSMATIADSIGLKRQSLSYHFRGKTEILSEILKIMDTAIQKKTPELELINESDLELTVLLEKLFFEFDSDSEMYFKILKIMLVEAFYNEYIRDYVINKFVIKHETYLEDCLSILIERKKLKPFDTAKCASILFKTVFSYAELAVISNFEYDKSEKMKSNINFFVNLITSEYSN